MQISTIIVIILHLNIFEVYVESFENKNNFQAYLKKTFSVLQNEKLSRNMRSLLKNLKQDDFRKKYYRRKKQILISNNLKDHPLFLLEEPRQNVQSQGLNKLDSLLANPLFAKNYVQSQTRSSNSVNGIDLNAIDKTDAQIVGALYYPSPEENSILQIEPTDSSNTESSSTLPATALNNALPNFDLNQISDSIPNEVPKQSESYYNHNDYMKNYIENMKMLPIYSNAVVSSTGNPPVVAPTPNAVEEYLKRCSTEKYESSQKEGLYNIFSDIYNNLKLNYIVTPTTPTQAAPIEDHNENSGSHSVNLTHPVYSGTANKPNGGASSSDLDYQNKKLLKPEAMETIVLTLKKLIENQTKRKLNRCNSNLPKSYENVLTPQLMALILNGLSNNIIAPKSPSGEQLNANDYLDKYVSKSTSEKSLPAENYLEKLPRPDNNNVHVDLDSLLYKPEKVKKFIYTNSARFQPRNNFFKSSPIRSERSTTLKQKGIRSKQKFELSAVQPKLSIFSNLNFPKRCGNSTGDNETSSKTNEKESFNTSSAIEEILKIVQDMRNKEKKLSEDVNCNILGSWSSMAGGMLLNVSKAQDILDVTLSEKSPPGKKGFLMDAGWIIKGVQPIEKTNLVILTGTNLNSKHVIVFIGECRVCGGSELVTGNWLIGRCSHNCQDQKASQDLLSDVWRREMLTKLCHDRLHAIANGHAAATTTADIKETSTSTDNNTTTSSNADEVCSETQGNNNATTDSEKSSTDETTADQKSETTDKTTNEPQSHDAKLNTPCKTTNELQTKDPKLETTSKTSNESHTKDQKTESTCATEEDLNFLFSSSSVATTASGENSSVPTEKPKPSILGNIEGNSSQDAEVEKMQKMKGHSGNKMFTLCNYNGPTTKAHHEHTEKATKAKCTTTTTTPSTTACEESTTENCNSSPSTSCEESTSKTTSCDESANKTTASNKCVIEIDVEKTTKKAKFLNKVIHIFKNKSKTTTEKCSSSEKCSTTNKCSTTEKCPTHSSSTECNT